MPTVSNYLLLLLLLQEEIPSGFKVLTLLHSKGFLSSGVRICYKSSLIATQSLSYTAGMLQSCPCIHFACL